VGERLRDYWRRQLADAELAVLPRLRTRSETPETRSRVERATIEREVVGSLQQLARARRTTIFPVMLSVYYALLGRLTGQTDLAVSSIFANRSRPEARNTVGFLSNMVVLRTALGPHSSFAEIVRSASATVIQAFANQELPYQMLPLNTLRAGSVRPDDVVFQMFTGPM